MSSEPLGIEGLADDDLHFSGSSRYADTRDAVFANPYPRPYPIFPVTLGSLLRGVLPFGKPWQFLAAAHRVVRSNADLRWGPDRKGYRRLVHASGICMTGMWEITEETPYSGYFARGSRGVMIARYSVSATEPRRGHTRSLAMAGRIWPTTDANDPRKLPSASFITQEDIGGAKSWSINQAVLRNAPNVTASRRGSGVPAFLVTGLVLALTDKQTTQRQVYEIAELGKPADAPTRAPEFMQFLVAPDQPEIPGDNLDFRDEIMAQVYETAARSLTFHIETSDTGESHGPDFLKRRTITNWRRIGTMRFDAAVASYNGDHVFHPNHVPWRQDRNDPSTAKVKRL